jgi:hypothetical protein
MSVQVRTCSMHAWMRGSCAVFHLCIAVRRGMGAWAWLCSYPDRDRKPKGQIGSQHMPLRDVSRIVGIRD